MLTLEQIQENSAAFKKQFSRFIDFGKDKPSWSIMRLAA
jgi:hypothetical protein